MGILREGQCEASLNLIGAIIPPWRGVPSATSVDRKSRSLDRFTGNSPCLRMAILGWPSQLTGPIRASRRTPVRAPPSAKRFRSIRCARLTRPHPVKIRRKWPPEAPRPEGQARGRWIMGLLSRAPLLLALSWSPRLRPPTPRARGYFGATSSRRSAFRRSAQTPRPFRRTRCRRRPMPGAGAVRFYGHFKPGVNRHYATDFGARIEAHE